MPAPRPATRSRAALPAAAPASAASDRHQSPRLHALVPCAGSGRRAGGDEPKQYRLLAGQTVVQRTLRALSGVHRLSGVWVVLSPQDAHFEQSCPDFTGTALRCGGHSRGASVAAGLEAMQAAGVDERDWVLVHDAARCMIKPDAVDRLIDACWDDAVGGLLARPVSDTLHRVQDDRIMGQQARDGLWQAQTPQMFRLGLLRQALKYAGEAVTDEASAVCGLGLQPRVVPGPNDNFKLTHPDDFLWAQRLLAASGAQTEPHD